MNDRQSAQGRQLPERIGRYTVPRMATAHAELYRRLLKAQAGMAA